MRETTYRGKTAGVYSLRNANGMEVTMTNFGCRIMGIVVPDADGKPTDVVQGFDNVDDYFPERHLSDFGAVIGRYANRLADGRVVVDGKVWQLPQNNGSNCLHGGPDGWQYAVFDVLSLSDTTIRFHLVSPDGDNGFPGKVEVWVAYTLQDDNALRVDYRAESDRPSVINMTNHSYWNLSGDLGSSATDHILQIDADRYTPVGDTLIPLGYHDPVAGTPMDFRKPKAIGLDIEAPFQQLRIGSGYDHNWVLNGRRQTPTLAAVLACPQSGISLQVYTNAPGMQVYTGNFLDGVVGKGGTSYCRRSAVCLETQQYPDSPNHNWPESTGRIAPDNPFSSTTIFKLKAQ